MNAAIRPGADAPKLSVPIVGGKRFDLNSSDAETFICIVAYRGLHCPICKKQLSELESKLDEFAERGVEVVAVSMDNEKRAALTKRDWGLDRMTLAYGLDEQTARRWGLFISKSIKDVEPRIFSEPGIFLVRPDGTLYAASVQSMPFARPRLDDLLSAIDFIGEKDYPPRGTDFEDDAREAA